MGKYLPQAGHVSERSPRRPWIAERRRCRVTEEEHADRPLAALRQRLEDRVPVVVWRSAEREDMEEVRRRMCEERTEAGHELIDRVTVTRDVRGPEEAELPREAEERAARTAWNEVLVETVKERLAVPTKEGALRLQQDGVARIARMPRLNGDELSAWVALGLQPVAVDEPRRRIERVLEDRAFELGVSS